MQRRSVHILVEGQVQGVGFRAWVEVRAAAHGLDGWVRNRRTGTVEAVFAGPSGAVEQMLEECSRGPPAARVARLDLIGEDVAVGPGFEIRATA